ncbi:glucose-6-phosphate dehydrogenase (NADP(+)) [Candidatus Dojkabacteria bacterium]|nr:glucose-6-phosphate dehydrogenase (NADP(+)) [Candidatus Dojkabacteria bacterium]
MDNQPTVLTFFGASGDLAKLKLYPSIYNLAENGLLPEEFKIIGFSRKEYTNEEFRKVFEESVRKKYGTEVKEEVLGDLLNQVNYHIGNYDNKADFESLRKKVFENVSDIKKVKNINYLSIPPFIFKDVINNLAETRESKEEDMRLIIEKPFGVDEESAKQLFHFANTHFDEKQIYLLDHYLGKLAVQSLLHIRRSNRILNSILHGREIANIQITVSEEVGVEERIGYFESVGNMKDMQSHLLQILALVTMNIPTSKTGTSLSREKYSVLSALSYTSKPEDLVVGQYESYCNHAGVPADSKTDTFAAFKLGIDLEEWYNVPIFIRVGKKMKRKETYVVIELEKYSFQKDYKVPMNRIIFKLHPDNQIHIEIYNQFLDGTMHELDLNGELLCDVKSNICDDKYSLTEYATLINDVIKGDKLFFLEFQEVLASWRIMDKIIKHMNSPEIKLEKYADGSIGPEPCIALPKADGFEWQGY